MVQAGRVSQLFTGGCDLGRLTAAPGRGGQPRGRGAGQGEAARLRHRGDGEADGLAEEPSPDAVADLRRLPEAKVVQEYGGTVRLIPYLPQHSTTELIAAIKQLPEDI